MLSNLLGSAGTGFGAGNSATSTSANTSPFGNYAGLTIERPTASADSGIPPNVATLAVIAGIGIAVFVALALRR